MEDSAKNIGIIVLAAGASKRLGKPKQLLLFQGETLLRRAAKTALASGCRPVFVVLGANAESLKQEIEELDVETVENSDWQSGMGASIQTGLQELLKSYPNLAGVILTVCDQPFVTAELITELARNFQSTDAPIVACYYKNTIGVPALFSRRYFPELITLKADNGAKKIIYEHLENVIKIPFESGVTDIDTEQDYMNLGKWIMDNG
jgi:molybdenum cofactor cytidylyltransferase